MRVQKACKIPIMIKPPECRAWQQKKLGPFAPEGLQKLDGFATIGGMVPGIKPAFALREVPGDPAPQMQKSAVPFANDDHLGIEGQDLIYIFLNPTDQF